VESPVDSIVQFFKRCCRTGSCTDSVYLRVAMADGCVYGCFTAGALLLIVVLATGAAVANDTANVVSSLSGSDFDRDGVVDHLDFDQDNDGIRNSDEGYISYANLADYPADSYMLLADVVVATDLQDTDAESPGVIVDPVFRYPLLNSSGTSLLDFAGTLVETDTAIDWSIQQDLPKFVHRAAGRSEVRWQFNRFGADEVISFDVDLEISDLDANRRESIEISLSDIAGYSVSSDTNLQLDASVPGSLVFTAAGVSDNSKNDAVTLHIRNSSGLTIIYKSSPNLNVIAGVDNDAAGFRHSFTAGALDNYFPVPVVRHSDNDDYPDHRDLDSNNDGIPDASVEFDRDRDGMIDGLVDSDGVPSLMPDDEIEPNQENVPPDLTAVQDQEEQHTIGNPVPASATLNLVSDLDRDSIADSVEGMEDSDQDGVPNRYDLDSDNDGLADVIEAGAMDVDHNGLIDDDANSPVRTFTTVVPDFDNDGQPDFLDSDSDQDGRYDLVEAGGEDLDENGRVDQLSDQNGDGWDDRFQLAALSLPDSDNDGSPDILDKDDSAGSVILDDSQQLADTSDLVTGAGCVLSNRMQPFDPVLWVFLLLMPLRWLVRRIVPSISKFVAGSVRRSRISNRLEPGGQRGVIGCLSLLLICCSSNGLDSSVPEMGAANESAIINLDGGNFENVRSPINPEPVDYPADERDGFAVTRLLTVYLQLDSSSGFQPVYADRVVVAQSVIPVIFEKAEGRMLVQGIPTVVVGNSCEELLQQYPQLAECNIVDSMEIGYSEVVASATPDQEGFASLEVGAGSVRVLLQSWPTIEDDKCHWSGSAVAEADTATISIPMLVFCE